MKFVQMQSFLAVAEHLNFSKAAEQVFLSQPAVSLQIRLLEKELGVTLFERKQHRISLTPAGRICFEHLRECAVRLDQMVERVRLADQGKLGRLRVGFISTAAVDIVSPIVRRFRRTHPRVSLELCDGLTAALIEKLERKELDVAFFRMPYPPSGTLRYVTIHEEPFRLFLPEGHPLAARRHISPGDLSGENFLMYARSSAMGYHDLLIRRLDEYGVHPSVIHEASDMYTLMSMVSAGMGVTIAPASIERYGVSSIVVRDLEKDFPLSQIAMAFPTELSNPVTEAFLDLVMHRNDPSSLSEVPES